MNLERHTLIGRHVRLEGYADPLRPELRAALDVDPAAWDLFLRSGQGRHFDAWWDNASRTEAAGTAVNFAIRRLSDGRVVGTSSLLDISHEHRHLEIGATFLHPEVRGGAANPEIKRLMLGAAFDAGAVRVAIVTDARNRRSQAAIAKLGAVREGVLRRAKITWTGHVRDTVVFSVTDLDWPEVRARLDARLATFSAPEGSSPAPPLAR